MHILFVYTLYLNEEQYVEYITFLLKIKMPIFLSMRKYKKWEKVYT
jgi:hypothetical protein